MHIDLDQIRATAPKWDFSFTIGGQTYQTRPWTLEHSVRFTQASGAADLRALRALLADVIEGDAPWHRGGAGEWGEKQLTDVISAIVAYRQELGRKNSDRIARAVASAVREETAQRNGTGRAAGAPSL